MAHVIHLRCEKCGAPTDATGVVWITCPSCSTVAGYDFTSFVDSPEIAEFMRRNATNSGPYIAKWQAHDAEMNRAALLHKKDPAAALAIAAEQAEFVLSETPWAVPPKAHAEPALRAAYKRWLGFDLLHTRVADDYRFHFMKLNEAAAEIGFGGNENPMPAFENMLAALRTMLELRGKLGSPPDPDGLSLEARFKLASAQLVSSYIRLVSPELQRGLLVKIYGKDVIDGRAIGGQDYVQFYDWKCPACGLYSPQHVTADQLTCPGCYCARRYDHDAQAFAALELPCHGCGATVSLGKGQAHAACSYCGSQVKRFARAGGAVGTVMAEIRKTEMAKHGGSYDEIVADKPGFGVTPGNRLERLRDGLVRIAQWYNKFITPARYLGLARASLPGAKAGELDALLARAQEQAGVERAYNAGDKSPEQLIEAARAAARK